MSNQNLQIEEEQKIQSKKKEIEGHTVMDKKLDRKLRIKQHASKSGDEINCF